VVNEEMYEEEDDDLPMQYRRLTAHLQTGSADFNRRLSAYLTNHVAMRSALDQAITNSYAQQYPNAPQFAHNHHNIYPSPFMARNVPPQQQPPQQHAPPRFVQPPYNILTGTPSFRSVQQMRSASLTGPHENSTSDQNKSTMSPVQGAHQVHQNPTSLPTKSVSPTGSTQSPHTPQLMQAPPPLQQSPQPYSGKQIPPPSVAKLDPTTPAQMYAAPVPHQPQQSYGMLSGYRDFGPLTASLPTESQLMLGSVLDPNDPMTSMFMAGSENLIQPFYNPMSPTQMKSHYFHPSYDGMSATLAPSALDMSPQNLGTLPHIAHIAVRVRIGRRAARIQRAVLHPK
jgi:hypothetical protein